MAGARSIADAMGGSAQLIDAARSAHALAQARDEDEALALLLAA
jgi:hypothetical protein